MKTNKKQNLEITYEYSALTIKRNGSYMIHINVSESDISCGVKQLYSLPSDGSIVFQRNTINEVKEIFEKGIKLIKKGWKNKYGDYEDECAFVICSNTTDISSSKINAILDELATSKSRIRVNPNTGNKIKVWIL